MLRFDVGEDLLHYCCNVDCVTVHATAPANVAVGARILRQIGAGARDGGQEPRAGSIELAEAGYRAAIGGHAVDRSLIPMPARWRQAAGARASWATTCKWLSIPSIKHHLIVTHDVTNVGTNRSQLASVAEQTKDTLETERLDVVADRGYFNSAEILACEEAGITVTLPKPMTSNAKAEGRFGKQDFCYVG